MNIAHLTSDAILRIGEVSEVSGRTVYVTVDKNKNLSDMFLDGDVLKNVAVSSYLEIKKGFLSIIGKVDGEKIIEERTGSTGDQLVTSRRTLTISLLGYINEKNEFVGGTKELPLIGNESFILSRQKLRIVHNLISEGSLSVSIGGVFGEDLDISLPIDGLFNSHIAIFGNTGSGKSNTLAYLYQELVRALSERNDEQFRSNSRFVLFDFNGEYIRPQCISDTKSVLSLSTRNAAGAKIPIKTESLLDVEILSILADATEKTQKPFIRRALNLYRHILGSDDPLDFIKNILRKRVTLTLQMADKIRAALLIDYFREILPQHDEHGEMIELDDDIEWHNQSSEFRIRASGVFLRADPNQISNTKLYQHIDNFAFNDDTLSNVIIFLYVQLISDVLSNRAQNEHIAPAVNKLKSKRKDIEKIFIADDDANFWESNFVVVDMNDINLEMKKTVPLLLAKQLYSEHKLRGPGNSLTVIVDEAHNILSRESFREAESWKDYRLETFEEIIKEGRKFGVFVTIASQRPNDISGTITSQAHNYFIHRLVNQRDLATIASAVSYIDKITEESIPTLPTGTCIFSGVASPIPLKLNVKELAIDFRPKSETLKFSDMVPDSD